MASCTGRLVVEPGHQRPPLIGELQALDVREAVGAVERLGADVRTVTMSSLKSLGVPLLSMVMM